jgi:hypothetical protein
MFVVDPRGCVVDCCACFERGDPCAHVTVVRRQPDPILDAGPRLRRILVRIDQVENGHSLAGQASALALLLGPADEHHLTHRSHTSLVAGPTLPVLSLRRARGRAKGVVTALAAGGCELALR